jgi:hypothetical protein
LCRYFGAPAGISMSMQNKSHRAAGNAGTVQTQGPTSVIRLPEGTAPERREAQGSGHVRLSGRDATLLSQLRNQYRKVFGVYFDAMEFTGNDLYARATLRECMGSGNGDLSALAVQFLAEDGSPRLHRRLGRADLDLDLGNPAA